MKNNEKLLLISDQHFSDDYESYFSDEANKLTIEFMDSIIKKINPDTIFILGDLIHGTMDLNKFCYDLFDTLDNLKVDTILISGNHDRNFYDKVDFSRYNYLQFKKNNFIEILFEDPSVSEKKVYLTHDGGNGVWVGEKKKSFPFSLRRTYNIPDESWLITGHTHFPYIDFEHKESSLGCFNFDSFKHHQTVLSFATIRIENSSLIYKQFDFGTHESLISKEIIERTILHHLESS